MKTWAKVTLTFIAAVLVLIPDPVTTTIGIAILTAIWTKAGQ